MVLSMVFCAYIFAQQDARAQSNVPINVKNERREKKRRKFTEKQRKRSRKGTVNKKSNRLQKSYLRKKTGQTQYPGGIWLNPKPKDFTAIKARVEKNPSRKSLKAEKSRKSYLRASSNRQQRSFGSAGVLKPNQKLSYKYASKAISRSKGNSKMRPPLAKYRKSSRKAQKHTGNIFLQPAAKKTGL
jgi:hypothetical protein